MSSIIEGYNYDIFISYRQKDNKGDKWVSEFVDALKTELESTFKEEISIYFDINPHNGLLETHDVDASLKDKLKCLVFIPIISRTYCDPKSFAWEHEFKAFIEEAYKDQFGLKVKLPSGNVANRVLPIRIRDLDSEDIKQCESLLGGYLRGVEFIYKEPGVNRPLKPDDDDKINLNKTKYRNQINKVANAIDEIISSLKIPVIPLQAKIPHLEALREVKNEYGQTDKKKSIKSDKQKVISRVAIFAILIIIAVFLYPKLFKKDTLDTLRSSGERISIAIMPFRNMTNDTTWNIWSRGIQDNLITSLSNSEHLKVRQTESVTRFMQSKGYTYYASITPSDANDIALKLNTELYVSGSISQERNMIRINAQLLDSKTNEILKTFQLDGIASSILKITDSLSVVMRNFLIINDLSKEITPDWRHIISSVSPEAFQYFILGDQAFNNGDYPTAIKLYSQVVSLDSNFILAYRKLSVAYLDDFQYSEAKRTCLRVYRRRDQLPIQEKIWTNWLYAVFFETPSEQLKYIDQIQKFDDQIISSYYLSGQIYLMIFDYDKAIFEFQKVLDLYKKWGTKPERVDYYSDLVFAYYKAGRLVNAKRLLKNIEKEFPDETYLKYLNAFICYAEHDTIQANHYIDLIENSSAGNGSNEEYNLLGMGMMLSFGGITDKAEAYFRKALSLKPDDPGLENYLAYFLIDHNKNMKEGIDLIDNVIKTIPGHYEFLHTKGWSLYKEGKYKEALETLQKSWDLRRQNAIYDHTAYLHLEEAKKAVANLK